MKYINNGDIEYISDGNMIEECIILSTAYRGSSIKGDISYLKVGDKLIEYED